MLSLLEVYQLFCDEGLVQWYIGQAQTMKHEGALNYNHEWLRGGEGVVGDNYQVIHIFVS